MSSPARSRPVRTLVVTNSLPTAGRPELGTFVADQVASVREVGVHADVLHVDRAAAEGGAPLRSSPIAGWRAYRSLSARVRRSVTETDPDVVHVMYGGVMAEIVTRTVRDRPVLVSFCGSDVLGGRAAGGLARLSEGIGVLASRRAATRASGVLVKSRNLLDALPRQLDPARVWVVPNGVDLACFRPLEKAACQEALGLERERRHVLFTAAPDRPEKRFALAEASMALLGHGTGVTLHTLAGRPHADVPTWLNAADAVLLTSVYEGSPNVIKEALACNVPVVSVDVGDVRERIQGIDGCYIAEPTPQDLAAKLRRVLERSERVDARERMAALSLEQTATKLRDIYVTLANGDARARAAVPKRRG
jgi:teichuronic acid biosynthesis glycosyltransferase TuaC